MPLLSILLDSQTPESETRQFQFRLHPVRKNLRSGHLRLSKPCYQRSQLEIPAKFQDGARLPILLYSGGASLSHLWHMRVRSFGHPCWLFTIPLLYSMPLNLHRCSFGFQVVVITVATTIKTQKKPLNYSGSRGFIPIQASSFNDLHEEGPVDAEPISSQKITQKNNWWTLETQLFFNLSSL